MDMRKTVARLLAVLLPLMLTACGGESGTATERSSQIPGTQIHLSDSGITVDGEPVSGDSGAPVYAAHDIVFYLEGQGFTYGEGTAEDEHSQSEADAHTVVHITAPGTYVLSGALSAGQIAVDLGEDAEEDEDAVVDLVLDNAEITCTVAPAIIFYNVYECGDKDQAQAEVDTAAAGANIILADGSENTVNGSYVARIYKSYELNEAGTAVTDSKKLHKYDGAVYSKMSMNIEGGDGVLNINAENEGLDSELHLTVNGGTVNIVSGNDGINTNEDGVSVTTVNGGRLTVTVDGSTGEGDGIDSNGWLVINGGVVHAYACAFSQDFGIDSDKGIILNGGEVVATGNMMDAIDGSSGQSCAMFRLSGRGGTAYQLRDGAGSALLEVPTVNDFSILAVSAPGISEEDCALYEGETLAASAQSGGMGGPGFPGGHMGPGGPGGQNPPDFPEGGTPPDKPEGQETGQRPDGPEGEGPLGMPDGQPPEGFPGGPEQSPPDAPEGSGSQE